MKLYRQAPTVYKTQYHIVWVARFRRKILTPGVASYLRVKLHEVCQYNPDWYFTAIDVGKDHVHVHMEIPPRYSVSAVVNIMKSNTSRALRAKFRFLDNVRWDRGGIWAKGFFVFTVGINEEIIKRYVQLQGAEDTGQAELEL